jgi:predicted O-linked N-acetylglucosamine transferase (SPINDLY family)
MSLLMNIGCTELIAKTREEYVEIAINLATDINKLQSLRAKLRDMLLQSPLTNAEQFTINLEKCYLKMWENYCMNRFHENFY